MAPRTRDQKWDLGDKTSNSIGGAGGIVTVGRILCCQRYVRITISYVDGVPEAGIGKKSVVYANNRTINS